MQSRALCHLDLPFSSPSFPSLFRLSLSSLSTDNILSLSLVSSLFAWPGARVENGRQSGGRAHLHDMNIMERAGSLANPDYESATC